MKCDNKAIMKDARKRGSGEPYRKVVRFFTPECFNAPEFSFEEQGQRLNFDPKDVEPCGGNIVVTVDEAYDECGDGDGGYSWQCYGWEVNFKCDKCGCTRYPGIESLISKDDDDVSKILTQHLAKMTKKSVVAERARLIEEHEKWHREYKERQEAEKEARKKSRARKKKAEKKSGRKYKKTAPRQKKT